MSITREFRIIKFNDDEASRDTNRPTNTRTVIPPTAEEVCAWWESERTMDAATWWQMKQISPEKAAMLLCGVNPEANLDPEQITTNYTTINDYKRMLRLFRDQDKSRPLAAWLDFARQNGLTYHPWIDQWLAAKAHTVTTPGKTPDQEQDWKKRARELAQEVAHEQWRGGVRHISARSLAPKVANRLEREGYLGLQGRRAPDTIRSALKGWRFKPPKSGSNGSIGLIENMQD